MNLSNPVPPVAPIEPKLITQHGESRTDNYFWLHDGVREQIVAYLQAENEYTRACMAHTEALQQTIYEEMLGRIQQTDMSAPVRLDGYEYFTRTFEGKQYPVYCRRVV